MSKLEKRRQARRARKWRKFIERNGPMAGVNFLIEKLRKSRKA